MRDHAHLPVDDDVDGICPHCGQPLPVRQATPTYGERKPNKIGIGITVGLHLLLVLVYLLQPQLIMRPAKMAETVVVMLQPPGKPKPREQAPKPQPKKATRKEEWVKMQRLANTITVPTPQQAETTTRPEPKPITQPPQEVDMQAYIEARKRARGATTQSAPTAAEQDNARAMANIQANIARANNAARGDDDGTGGLFTITNQTFHSAELKFRGWNTNFKRRWLQDIIVEQGTEKDIETAVVNKMIEIIRKEKKGDFDWESHRLGKVVTLSARVEDTATLQAFLYKEIFPKYRVN